MYGDAMQNKTQYLKLYCNLFSRIGNLRHRLGPIQYLAIPFLDAIKYYAIVAYTNKHRFKLPFGLHIL